MNRPHLVILDRDGVINHDSEHYIKSPQEWRPIVGSLEAIAQLNQANIRVAVATNQSGLARGLFTLDTLTAIHTSFQQQLQAVNGRIDHIAFCPHGPDDRCTCRKPQPGLVYQIEEQLQCSAKGQPFVGDSFRDLQAAESAGCQPILVLTGNGKKTYTEQRSKLKHIPIYDTLSDAITDWLNST